MKETQADFTERWKRQKMLISFAHLCFTEPWALEHSNSQKKAKTIVHQSLSTCLQAWTEREGLMKDEETSEAKMSEHGVGGYIKKEDKGGR